MRGNVIRGMACIALALPLPACGTGGVNSASSVAVDAVNATRDACTIAGVAFGWRIVDDPKLGGAVYVPPIDPVPK